MALTLKLILLESITSRATFPQTPPAIPTLLVAVVSSLLRGSKLIVDYHNYGHTILALTLGKDHRLVKIAQV